MKLCAESCKQLPPTAELPFGKEYRGAEDFPLTSLVAKAFIKKPYMVLLSTLVATARSISIAASVTALPRFTSQVHLHYNSRDVPYICQCCTTTGCSLLHLLYISSTSISCDNYNNLDAICITSLYS